MRLRLLGAPSLVAADGAERPDVFRQPKRLAVLAYLVAADRAAARRRDVLLALFWPDADDARARAALRRALHYLRRAVGDVIVSRGEELVVPADGLWCDVPAFRAAAREGPLEEALALYRGDLLDGVFVPTAPAFEDWLEEERRHLRRTAADVARRLADAARSREVWADAVTYARRATELVPDDETAFRVLLEALAATGGRAAALQEYERFAERLAREFALQPAADTEALVARIRGSRPAPPRDALHADTLVVFPFAVRGSAELAYLGDGIVELLRTKLDGAGGLTTLNGATLVPPTDPGDGVGEDRARDLAAASGAGQCVTGSFLLAGGRLRVQATLQDLAGGATVRTAVEAAGDAALFELVDDLVRQLLARRGTSVSGRLARLAASTTASLDALKAYLTGERAYRLGRHAEAAAALEQGLGDDPQFAFAAYRLATVRLAMGLPDEARAACAGVTSGRDRLPRHARELLAAFEAWLGGSLHEAEERCGRVLNARPDDVEGWFRFGSLQLDGDAFRGRPPLAARRIFARIVRRDPRHVGALTELARIAARERRADEAQRWLDELVAVSPAADALPLVRVAASLIGGAARASELLRVVADVPGTVLAGALGEAAVVAPRAAAVRELADHLADLTTARVVRSAPYLVGAHLALLHGAPNEAEERFALAARFDPSAALVHRVLLAVHAQPAARDRLEALRAEVLGWTPGAPRPVHAPGRVHDAAPAAWREYLLGLLAVRLGDRPEVEERAAACAAAPAAPPAETLPAALALGIGALAADAAREPHVVLALLEQVRWGPWIHWAAVSPGYALAGERLLNVRALAALGRADEARAWAAGLACRSPWEVLHREAAVEMLGR